MSPGSSTESYPAFAHIGLKENPGKNLNEMPTMILPLVFFDGIEGLNSSSTPMRGAERARCVFLFEETKSTTVVQRRFRTQYGKNPPTRATFILGTVLLLRLAVLLPMPNLPDVHVWLMLWSNKFSGRWIGRGGPTSWPPRSPDLTPLYFFLWRFLKDKVYVPLLPANLAELRNRITAAVELVTPDMLQRVREEIEFSAQSKNYDVLAMLSKVADQFTINYYKRNIPVTRLVACL
ncbi:hypothetical protein ANN_17678 [Periplaneta americana]|uniref:DUF4817 domain-containing protein n=1 Tax=Periplaneta americana TaxID=6978 RepID=A0ABQ8STK9_PERAM|nr:hypothetical protein ANN_17678 [Periplaneta americana]